MSDPPVATCWLCHRPLGARHELHHLVPKARGGREVRAVHPICHRTIHAALTNRDLERLSGDRDTLVAHPAIARFLVWIANKPPDFHAPTRRKF